MVEAGSGANRFFFCRTPLQALIIQRIQAELTGIDTIFYNPTSASPKHWSYFHQIKGERRVFVPYNYPLNSHIAAEFYEYLAVPGDMRSKRYDEMYLASIGSLAFATLAGRNPGASLRTFDDGTLNVRRSHFENWIKDEKPVHHRMLWRALSAVSNREIFARAERHYTIFDRTLALSPEKEIVKLDLFAGMDQVGAATKRELVVVLGTPIHLYPCNAAERYSEYVRSLAPDLYIPHPAEVNVPPCLKTLNIDVELAEYLNERIAEEIVWLLRRRGHSLRIHGFGSTALINVASLGKVSNHLVNSEDREHAAVFASFGIESDYPF